jgi:hypothetical protein
MVYHNPKKRIDKKTNNFHFTLWWFGIYLHEKNTCHNVLKNVNIFQKWLKWFLIFMKSIIFISHVISHNLNQICDPFEIFDYFHDFDHKYVVNWHLTNNHSQMEFGKCFEVGLFFKNY